MSTRDAYVQKLKAQIDDWNADITKLEAKAGQAAADAKIKYEQSLDSLRAERDQVSEKLEQIQESSEDAWEEFQGSAEDLWDRTKAAFAAAKAEFED
jgi:uncharacterized coiled-coil DUF342 family protein